MTTVTAESPLLELERLFEKYELCWDNLVSVLMDSCAVMRGCKSGLETLVRQKVPTLLNIDGDTCHHAHIAAKNFCKPFQGIVESLMRDIHTEFRWSTELKDKLFDLCQVLGVKATAPERYVPHRWLSVLDVAVDTLRLFDALTLFYYSYLAVKEKELNADIIEETLTRCDVSQQGRRSVLAIQSHLRSKFKSCTDEGKDRKLRLAEKFFSLRIDVLCTLHIFTSILPCLKKYVLFFQKKDPAMHRLHDKQHELFNEFCGNFLKPESLEDKMPHQIDIENSENHESDKGMFFPKKAFDLVNTREGVSHKKFISKLRQAYISCALTLQKKMPVNNPILKGCAALDPTVRKTSTARSHLRHLQKLKVSTVDEKTKKEKSVSVLVKPEDEEAYLKEVMAYTSAPNISVPAEPIDVFWANMDSTRFPLLVSVAKKLISAFHGPAVESSFSTMGNILHSGCSRMDIATYASIQAIKYHLASNKTTAMQLFGQKDVSKKLALKMQKAWVGNEDRKETNKQAAIQKKVQLGAPMTTPASKTAGKKLILSGETATTSVPQKRPAKDTEVRASLLSGETATTSVPQKWPAEDTAVRASLLSGETATTGVPQKRPAEDTEVRASLLSGETATTSVPQKRPAEDTEVRASPVKKKKVQKTVKSFFKKL